MSHVVPPDAQGELQGAVACLYSLSSIVGPPLLTQLFGRFSAPDAPVRVPGMAFFAASALAAASFAVYVAATRAIERRPHPAADAPLQRA
jgi:DHA1 family tetracycline resistance protein-like MFS transporter